MGRRLLLILLACALACADSEEAGRPPSDRVARGPGDTSLADAPAAVDDPHGDLACVRCHQGGRTDREVDAVPSRTCASGGCHQGGGPRRVRMAGVELRHEAHGAEAESEAGCAACHTHESGDAPLATVTQGCTLCHASQLDGDEPGDCRACHGHADHSGFTSQGLPVPHEDLPWISGQCVRCHYDVGQPVLAVEAASCAGCHTNVAAVMQAGIGQDLHPEHTVVGCTSCHQQAEHRIVAMSSAVALECSHCHVRVHGVDVAAGVPGTVTCNACHPGAHLEQQRLMLGVAPAGIEATPSDKFMAGMTCRSCHIAEQALSDDARTNVGSSTSCAACHAPQYETVLGWWKEGLRERRALVQQYVAGARRAAASSEAAAAPLLRADSLLAFVDDADGHHNMPLSHRSMEAAVAQAARAYRELGLVEPPPPELGRQPRMGLCTYCHYRWREPRFHADMPDRFHREVLGVREREVAGAAP